MEEKNLKTLKNENEKTSRLNEFLGLKVPEKNPISPISLSLTITINKAN